MWPMHTPPMLLDPKKLTFWHKAALFFAPVSVGLLLMQSLPSG